jgi:uncharacterized protein
MTDPRDPDVSYPTGVVVHDEVVRRRAPWSHVVRRGETLRIIDLEGNQAVDCVHLVTGTVLMSTEGHPMMTITGSTCERHDTIGGACSKESNTLRYGHHTFAQHACVENFVLEASRHGMGKRDIQSNINWFMNVPVEEDGSLGIVDGISAPGLWVDLRAEMDTLVVVSNCPQINNPCNGFDPSPVRMVVTAAAASPT